MGGHNTPGSGGSEECSTLPTSGGRGLRRRFRGVSWGDLGGFSERLMGWEKGGWGLKPPPNPPRGEGGSEEEEERWGPLAPAGRPQPLAKNKRGVTDGGVHIRFTEPGGRGERRKKDRGGGWGAALPPPAWRGESLGGRKTAALPTPSELGGSRREYPHPDPPGDAWGSVPAVPAAWGGARARRPPGSVRSRPPAAGSTRPRPRCSRAGGRGGPRDHPLWPPGPLWGGKGGV